jgi:hypothetical protein
LEGRRKKGEKEKKVIEKRGTAARMGTSAEACGFNSTAG